MISQNVQSEIDKLPSHEQMTLWFWGIHLSCKISHSDIQGLDDVRLDKDSARELRDLLLGQKE